MPWVGPFQLRNLLENTLNKKQPLPKGSKGVYLVTEEKWSGTPSEASKPMYVGSVTGDNERFLSRVGELIIEILGFSSEYPGRHRGGQLIHEHCFRMDLKPLDLWIAWKTHVRCNRCEEMRVFRELNPWANKNTPPTCKEHG